MPCWSLTSRPPVSAAIARKVYLNNGLGVGKLSKIYGGKKRRGVRASKFQAGSTSVARAVLQSLETIKVIDKKEDGCAAAACSSAICVVELTRPAISGRVITVDGQRDLDRIAGQVLSKLQKN